MTPMPCQQRLTLQPCQLSCNLTRHHISTSAPFSMCHLGIVRFGVSHQGSEVCHVNSCHDWSWSSRSNRKAPPINLKSNIKTHVLLPSQPRAVMSTMAVSASASFRRRFRLTLLTDWVSDESPRNGNCLVLTMWSENPSSKLLLYIFIHRNLNRDI